MVGMIGKICERNGYEGKNRDGHALGTSCTWEMVMGIIEHEGWRGMVETFANAGHAWPCKCGGIGLMDIRG